MKVPLLFVYLTVLYLGTAVVALQQPTSNAINSRRSFVQSTLATTAATFTLSSPASAEEKTAAATKPAEKKEDKPAAKSDKNSFVGSYTDPNHPGGKTTIRLTGNSVGDYVLAEVVGGGGKNEPANYVLPAVLMGERTIFIDFTSKGGPRNFVGFLNKDGDIDFLKDGNRWNRIS